MLDMTDIADRYVSVWNEPNADRRRERVRSLWAPDGATCHRMLDARGYDAIEARVTGSWDKWLREEGYAFRATPDALSHHGVVKLNWEMVTVPAAEVEGVGLSFLILDSDARIRSDYQFNPTVNEASELVERYLSFWNAETPRARRELAEELWAADGAYISRTTVRIGRSAIAAEAEAAHDAHTAKGLAFSSANSSQAHHNVARLAWQLRAKDSGMVVAAGSDLLIHDETGRLLSVYRFNEPS
jgi:hypothetical protein